MGWWGGGLLFRVKFMYVGMNNLLRRDFKGVNLRLGRFSCRLDLLSDMWSRFMNTIYDVDPETYKVKSIDWNSDEVGGQRWAWGLFHWNTNRGDPVTFRGCCVKRSPRRDETSCGREIPLYFSYTCVNAEEICARFMRENRVEKWKGFHSLLVLWLEMENLASETHPWTKKLRTYQYAHRASRYNKAAYDLSLAPRPDWGHQT